MRSSSSILAGFLGLASAQNMNLTALLGSTPQLSALTKLLQIVPDVAASLSNASNITLFAPSNSAIQQLRQSGIFGSASQAEITALLDYHVGQGKIYASDITSTPAFAPTLLNNTMYANVTGGQVIEAAASGGTVTLTTGLKAQSNVTQANLNFTGGVLHVIDAVLTIPEPVSVTALAANLTALAGALEATDLLQTVDGLSDVTIFAPVNEAFEAIGNLAGKLSTQQLTDILEYHVINGTVGYSTALTAGNVKALNGNNLKISFHDNDIFVNAARVVNPNILIAGGVLHIIDSVLNPNNTSVSPKPSATTPVVQFSGASTATNLALTSGITASTTVSALVATTTGAAAGATKTSGGGSGSGSGSSSGSSSSSGMAALPTAAMGAAALFGGAAFMANW